MNQNRVNERFSKLLQNPQLSGTDCKVQDRSEVITRALALIPPTFTVHCA